ncbi:MAG: hypothetical protein AAF763_07450 [Pseudomonadota bacterium]
MSLRNVILVGGLSLVGMALLMGVAERRQDGLLPGSAKAPGSGGLFFSSGPAPRATREPGDAPAPSTAPNLTAAPAVSPAPIRSPIRSAVEDARSARIASDDDDAPARIRTAAEASALGRDLLEQVLAGALDALRAARDAGDRVFGRDRAEAPDAPLAPAPPED